MLLRVNNFIDLQGFFQRTLSNPPSQIGVQNYKGLSRITNNIATHPFRDDCPAFHSPQFY